MDKKLKGAGSKGVNCERSKGHGPTPNRPSLVWFVLYTHQKIFEMFFLLSQTSIIVRAIFKGGLRNFHDRLYFLFLQCISINSWGQTSDSCGKHVGNYTRSKGQDITSLWLFREGCLLPILKKKHCFFPCPLFDYHRLIFVLPIRKKQPLLLNTILASSSYLSSIHIVHLCLLDGMFSAPGIPLTGPQGLCKI